MVGTDRRVKEEFSNELKAGAVCSAAAPGGAI